MFSRVWRSRNRNLALLSLGAVATSTAFSAVLPFSRRAHCESSSNNATSGRHSSDPTISPRRCLVGSSEFRDLSLKQIGSFELSYSLSSLCQVHQLSTGGVLKLLSYLLLNFGTFPAILEAMRRDFEAMSGLKGKDTQTGEAIISEQDSSTSSAGWFYLAAVILQFSMVLGFFALYFGLDYCKCDQNNRWFSSGRFEKFKAIWVRYKGPVQCLLALIIIIQYCVGLDSVGLDNKGYWAQIICNAFLFLANFESLWDFATNRICISRCCGDDGIYQDAAGNWIDPSPKLEKTWFKYYPIYKSRVLKSTLKKNNQRNRIGSVEMQPHRVASVSGQPNMGSVMTQRRVGGSMSQQRKSNEELIFFY